MQYIIPTLTIIVAVALSLYIALHAPACAQQSGTYYCPFQPLIPLGCKTAMCQCDADGNCYWVYGGCE